MTIVSPGSARHKRERGSRDRQNLRSIPGPRESAPSAASATDRDNGWPARGPAGSTPSSPVDTTSSRLLTVHLAIVHRSLACPSRLNPEPNRADRAVRAGAANDADRRADHGARRSAAVLVAIGYRLFRSEEAAPRGRCHRDACRRAPAIIATGVAGDRLVVTLDIGGVTRNPHVRCRVR